MATSKLEPMFAATGWLALLMYLTPGCESCSPQEIEPELEGESGQGEAGEGGSQPRAFPTATAVLAPLAAGDANDGTPLQGTASFTATSSGVDLEVTISGCVVGPAYNLSILEAADCTPASLDAPVWGDGRGADITALACTGVASGVGRLAYSRHAAREDDWTIDGPSESDLVGKVFVARDSLTSTALACGVIERGSDRPWIPLPPDDAPPSVEVRAQLAGGCLIAQFATAATEGCPDHESLVQCTAEHCDLGSCLRACADHAACLDATANPCASTFTCAASAECLQCQLEVFQCLVGFCGKELICTPPITPDGPCSQLLACCAMQGEGAASCLAVFQAIVSAGDPSCLSAMNDWDVVAHMRVPCRYME